MNLLKLFGAGRLVRFAPEQPTPFFGSVHRRVHLGRSRTGAFVAFMALCQVPLLYTGCESVGEARQALKERLETRHPGRAKVFAGGPREAFAAARAAAETLGFRYVRGGAATGRLEAISEVRSDQALRGSRQLVLKAELHRVEAGVEVRVRLTEVEEQDSTRGAGFATESPLQDTPLYEVFFRELSKRLVQEA